jgi:hypothetical protein
MLERPALFRPARADWLQAGLVSLALFLLYAANAPHTVALEDDGLFVLSSYFLGIEHPPGYPLFTLAGHLFSQLPFGAVAWRVHLASAFFGALSCGAAWLCGRALAPGRLPAYVAALGLGVSPVFWSQAIIAEVYTLNTLFFLVLVFLGVSACPPRLAEVAALDQRRRLPWMALLFGLSLSNHYPLMLLVAPAFAVLLFPVWRALLERFGLLSWLVVAGLLPYAWLVYRSWAPLPISFYGPLDSLKEIWFFISRSGYADIDQSATATWLDRIKFFEFQTGELFMQFAVLGTLLAGAGFVVQWRVLGRRVAAFLTLAFLLSTALLMLLLGFDYDSMHKHIYQVYPLPAYAVAALWMGLGAAWALERYALRPRWAVAAAAALLALVFAVGARENFLEDHEWGARFARTVLKELPPNAVVFGAGDPDLVPMAYFHMIEQWRPDITLYHAKGLVLGNRLFHAERTDAASAQRIVEQMVRNETRPVVATLGALSSGAQRDHWLYSEMDKSSTDPQKVTVDITPAARQFFDDSILQTESSNAWVAFIQGELRRRYAVSLARSLRREVPLDDRTRRELDLLGHNFYGALGLAEGQMLNPQGYSAGAVAASLEQARQLMQLDVPKEFLSRFFYIRGALRANVGERAGAIEDMETAISVWRRLTNPAIKPLEDLYREAGNQAAVDALHARVKTFKVPRS